MTSTQSNAMRWTVRALLLAFTTLIGTALVVPDADAARRLGGARSFGRQAAPPAQRQAPDAAPQPAPPAQREATRPQQPGQQAAPGQPAQPPAAAPAGNRWLGPLAGIAAGLGIAALLSHLGLSGALAQFLGSVLVVGLLVLAALFVWRLLRGASSHRPLERRMEPAYSGAAGSAAEPNPGAAYVPSPGAPRPGSVAATLGSAGSTQIVQSAPRPGQVPADFDAQAFLRNAKVHFHRLQESWGRRDLEDLSEFTTPEVFAELRTQLAEQPGLSGRNEVTALEADLLGIDEGASDWLASVRFRGAMREADARAAEPFEEIWNLSKRKVGRSGWLLAGIQQVS